MSVAKGAKVMPLAAWWFRAGEGAAATMRESMARDRNLRTALFHTAAHQSGKETRL